MNPLVIEIEGEEPIKVSPPSGVKTQIEIEGEEPVSVNLIDRSQMSKAGQDVMDIRNLPKTINLGESKDPYANEGEAQVVSSPEEADKMGLDRYKLTESLGVGDEAIVSETEVRRAKPVDIVGKEGETLISLSPDGMDINNRQVLIEQEKAAAQKLFAPVGPLSQDAPIASMMRTPAQEKAYQESQARIRDLESKQAIHRDRYDKWLNSLVGDKDREYVDETGQKRILKSRVKQAISIIGEREKAVDNLMSNEVFKEHAKKKGIIVNDNSINDPKAREVATEFLYSSPSTGEYAVDLFQRAWDGAIALGPAAFGAAGVAIKSADRIGGNAIGPTLGIALRAIGLNTVGQYFEDIASGGDMMLEQRHDPRSVGKLGEFGRSLAGGAGSLATMIIPGTAVVKGAKMGGASASAINFLSKGYTLGASAALSSWDQYKDARAHGASDEDASLAAFFAAITQAPLELVSPVPKWLNKLAGDQKNKVAKALSEGVIEAFQEASVETVQNVSSQAIAQRIYDKNRDLFEGAEEAAGVGGITGGVFSLLVSAATRGKGANPSLTPTDKKKEEILEKINQAKQGISVTDKAKAVAEMMALSQRQDEIKAKISSNDKRIAEALEKNPEEAQALSAQNEKLQAEFDEITAKIGSYQTDESKANETTTEEKKTEVVKSIDEQLKELGKELDQIDENDTEAIAENERKQFALMDQKAQEQAKAVVDPQSQEPVTKPGERSRAQTMAAIKSEGVPYNKPSVQQIGSFQKTVNQTIGKMFVGGTNQKRAAKVKAEIKRVVNDFVPFLAGTNTTVISAEDFNAQQKGKKNRIDEETYNAVIGQDGQLYLVLPNIGAIVSRETQTETRAASREAAADQVKRQAPKKLEEEIIHLAMLHALKEENRNRGGKPGTDLEYVSKRLKQIATELRKTNPNAVPAVADVYFGDSKKSVNDDTLSMEFVRIVLQRIRTGQITEDAEAILRAEQEAYTDADRAHIAALKKAITEALVYIRETIARYLTPETSTPEVRKIVSRTEMVLDRFGVVAGKENNVTQKDYSNAAPAEPKTPAKGEKAASATNTLPEDQNATTGNVEQKNESPEAEQIPGLKERLATPSGIKWAVVQPGSANKFRPVVFMKMPGGGYIPFYRSSRGTGGKTVAKWYPFFGEGDGGWLVKLSNIDFGNGPKSFEDEYGIPAIQEAQNWLNENLNYDPELDRNQSEQGAGLSEENPLFKAFGQPETFRRAMKKLGLQTDLASYDGPQKVGEYIKGALEKMGAYPATPAGTIVDDNQIVASAKKAVTPQQDAEYLTAVNRGDMATAQRMVDEAAIQSGYTSEAFHGTHSPEITSFNRLFRKNERRAETLDAAGTWFTDSAKVARELYGPNVLRVFIKKDGRVAFQTHKQFSDYVEQIGGSEEFAKAHPAGAIIEGDFVDGELQTIQIIPDPARIKSADPVTYDEDGNIVPLSERFNEQSPMIFQAKKAEVAKFKNLTADLGTKPTRQEIEAWKQANPEKYAELEAMKADVLRAAGYNVGPVYHHGGFNVEENAVPDTGRGFHFGTKAAAEERAFGKPVDDFISNATVVFDEDLGAWFWSSDGTDSYDVVGEEGFKTETAARRSLEEFATQENFSDATLEDLGTLTGAFIKVSNPLRVTDQKADWSKAIEQAKAEGRDAIEYKNEFEDKGSTSYIALTPNQVKSADPLELDDNGNLVTPDQWGNPDSPYIFQAKKNAERVAEKISNKAISDIEKAANALEPKRDRSGKEQISEVTKEGVTYPFPLVSEYANIVDRTYITTNSAKELRSAAEKLRAEMPGGFNIFEAARQLSKGVKYSLTDPERFAMLGFLSQNLYNYKNDFLNSNASAESKDQFAQDYIEVSGDLENVIKESASTAGLILQFAKMLRSLGTPGGAAKMARDAIRGTSKMISEIMDSEFKDVASYLRDARNKSLSTIFQDGTLIAKIQDAVEKAYENPERLKRDIRKSLSKKRNMDTREVILSFAASLFEKGSKETSNALVEQVAKQIMLGNSTGKTGNTRQDANKVIEQAIASVLKDIAKPDKKKVGTKGSLDKLASVMANDDQRLKFIVSLEKELSKKYKNKAQFEIDYRDMLDQMKESSWSEGLRIQAIKEVAGMLGYKHDDLFGYLGDTRNKTANEIKAHFQKVLGPIAPQEKIDKFVSGIDEYLTKKTEEVLSKKLSSTIDGKLSETMRKQVKELSKEELFKKVKGIRDIAKMSFSQTKAFKEAFIERVIDEIGLPEKESAALAQVIESSLTTAILAQKNANLESAIKRAKNALKAKGIKEENKGFEEKLIEMAFEGVLSSMDVYEAFRQTHKFPAGFMPYSHTLENELLAWGERAMSLPEGDMRAREQQRMMRYYSEQAPVSFIKDTLPSWWYMSLLTGVGTYGIVNPISSTINILGNMAVWSLQNPKTAIPMMKGLLDMMIGKDSPARNAFSYVMETGDNPSGMELRFPKVDVVENAGKGNKNVGLATKLAQAVFAGVNIRKKIGGFGNEISPRAMLRSLRAADAFFRTTAYEVAARRMGYKADPEAFAKAKKQAEGEVLGLILDESTKRREVIMRAQEIYNSQRIQNENDQQMIEQDARESVFGQEPQGVLGWIAGVINAAAEKTTVLGFPTSILVAPFTKIVANVFNSTLNWTPIGGVRAASGYYKMKAGIDPQGSPHVIGREDKAIELAVKSILGTALSLLVLLKPEEEDKTKGWDVYGSGPLDKEENKVWREAGGKPYTIRIGTRYIPYQATPFAIALAMGAEWREAKKKERESKVARTNTEKAVRLFITPFAVGASSMMDQSFFTGVSDLVETLNSGDVAGGAVKMTSGIGSRFLVPGFVRDINSLFDSTRYQASNPVAGMLTEMPIINKHLAEPALNLFGDPVKSKPLSVGPVEIPGRISNRLVSEQESSLAMQVLLKNGLEVGDWKRTARFGQRSMTYEETREYIKTAGPLLKSFLEDNAEEFLELSSEEAQEILDANLRDIRAYAKDQVAEKFAVDFYGEAE